MANVLVARFKLLASKGFFHIFGANVINKAIGFGTNIAIVWFLTKDEYGVFSYANNIYSIAMLLTGLGLLSGMFQFCLEKRPACEKNDIYRYTLTRGLMIDVLFALLILTVGLFVPLAIGQAGIYLAMFGPLIVLDYVFQYEAGVLRIGFDNKRYAALLTVNTVTYFIAACLGAFLGGITGTIAGRYVAYLFSIAIGALFLFRAGFRLCSLQGSLNRLIKKELWKYSVSTQLSAGINSLTYLLDVFLVGLFIQNAGVVAIYKVATLLPEGFSFIPASVITFALPYFVSKNKDRKWFERKSGLLLGVGSVVYFIIAFTLIAFAPWIIRFLWGASYLDAVLPFQILSVSFFFNALRATCTNLLCTVRATKSNLLISLISLIVNVVLCLTLIPSYGVLGAAFAPLLVSIVAAFIAFIMLRKAIKKIPEVVDGREA